MAKRAQKHKNQLTFELGVLVLLIIAVFALAAIQQKLISSGQFAAVISSVLVDLTNQDRLAYQAGTLTVNETLVSAAQAKANDMVQKQYFAHDSPEGLDSWHWFEKEGYEFLYAGENLAVNFTDSAQVESAWMNSPSHRANLLNDNFTEIGIATAEGFYMGRKTTFVVQMFGTPREESSTVSVGEVRTVQISDEPEAPVVATTIPEEELEGSVLASEVENKSEQNTKETETPSVAGESYTQNAPFWGFLATSPKTLMQYAYYLIGAFILFALIARTGVEIKRHHFHHVGIALGLIVLMLILFFVAEILLFAEPVLAR